jgi:hypothetical protein
MMGIPFCQYEAGSTLNQFTFFAGRRIVPVFTTVDLGEQEFLIFT